MKQTKVLSSCEERPSHPDRAANELLFTFAPFAYSANSFGDLFEQLD
jgi:hypothetical protein